MASRVTARQVIASREALDVPARFLPPLLKRQCQRRNARAETNVENREILTTKLTANAEAKAEEMVRVALHQAVGV